MKLPIGAMLTMLFLFFALNVSAASVTPPDSTSSLVDKASAIYLIDEGLGMYNAGKVKDALTKFREASIKDPNSWKALYWQGKCHYRLNNFGFAVKYGKSALNTGDSKVDPEVYFLLGQSYHRLANLDTAITNYESALKLMKPGRVNLLEVEKHLNHCKHAKEVMKSEQKYTRHAMPGSVNSGFDEYGVVFADSGKAIYFTSRRPDNKGGGLNPDDQLFFEDIYRATFDDGTNGFEEITNDLGRLNTEGFDALNYLSNDGMYGVMTLNTTALDIKKTTRSSDLCEIKKNNKGDFNSPKPIVNKTINTSYFEGAATVTADGNTMYFVTDRKGEKSSTDIYVVHKVGKKWGEAEPLPFTINTTGRETTPFITPDGRFLFFSSDGHMGLGGLDVYVVENKGNSWGTPINLGYGINTVNHDTHFAFNEASMKAYISGIEVVGNKSSMDIYEMDLTGFEIPAN